MYVLTEGSDRRVEFANLKAAQKAMWKRAKEIAEYSGMIPEELEEWADEKGCGVSPDGDTGAYWPQILYPAEEEPENEPLEDPGDPIVDR